MCNSWSGERGYSESIEVMEETHKIWMTCMTTKRKFEVEEPDVIVLKNGRYAYKVKCPWQGKNEKDLYAFKFCSAANYEAFQLRKDKDSTCDNFQEHTENDAEREGGESE
jgi:hypothetical protein